VGPHDDTIREAGFRYLTGNLANRRFALGLLEAGPPGWGDESDPALDALLALGALSADEAAAWRARFQRAESPPEEVSPGVQARAAAYLDALEPEDRFDAALVAFAGSGLIAQEEAERRRGLMPQPDEPDAPPGSELDRIRRAMKFDDSELIRALVGPERAVAGLRVTVVELFAGGVVVNWHFSATEGETPEADGLWRRLSHDDWSDQDEASDDDQTDEQWLGVEAVLSLADDVGTDYVPAMSSHGGAVGGIRTSSGHIGFAPAVPAGTAHLDVLVEGESLRVEL
jgi:hypothetical protein